MMNDYGTLHNTRSDTRLVDLLVTKNRNNSALSHGCFGLRLSSLNPYHSIVESFRLCLCNCSVSVMYRRR